MVTIWTEKPKDQHLSNSQPNQEESKQSNGSRSYQWNLFPSFAGIQNTERNHDLLKKLGGVYTPPFIYFGFFIL